MSRVKRIAISIHEKKMTPGLVFMFFFDIIVFFFWESLILNYINHEQYMHLVILVLFVLIILYKLYEILGIYRELRNLSLTSDYEVNSKLLHNEKEHAKNLLVQIRLMNKTESKAKVLDFINQNLVGNNHEELTDCPCVNAMIQHYRDVSSINGIEFDYSLPENLHDAHFERKVSMKVLSTIVGNLMDNAVDALKMSARKDKKLSLNIGYDNEITYTVTNNGDKIKDVGKIFEPRFSTKGRNRGLGLVAVMRVVNDVNGTIDVSSTNKETRFEVSI